MDKQKELISYQKPVNYKGNYLSFALKRAMENGLLLEANIEIIQSKLWMLLEKQSDRFTMGDSSSVPVETAQELLLSICFCIEMHLNKSSNTLEAKK